MEIIWPFIISSIAGLSTLIGCIPIFFNIKRVDEFITFSISLSLSVMIMISLFDLIPSSLPYIGSSSILGDILFFTLFFSLGIFLINLINHFIQKEKGSSTLYKVGILSFIALLLHNLPEGILTFMSTYKDFELGVSLCIAIALHNIPEGISIAIPIYYAKKSRWEAIKCVFISALSEPLGALLAFLILKNYITNQMISIFLILVAGIMISLSINKLFPEALSYNKNKYIIYGMITGIIVTIISLFAI